MKKLTISIALALLLVAAIAIPVMAAEQNLTASVTITEVISVTVADAGSNGIQFGELAQGDTEQPDIAQSTSDDSTPAVTVTMGAENNVDCDVNIKGTDFHTSIPIENAKWAEGAHDASKNVMTDSFALVKSDVAASGVVSIWHFITIPGDAAGGTFDSTFTYEAVAATP